MQSLICEPTRVVGTYPQAVASIAGVLPAEFMEMLVVALVPVVMLVLQYGLLVPTAGGQQHTESEDEQMSTKAIPSKAHNHHVEIPEDVPPSKQCDATVSMDVDAGFGATLGRAPAELRAAVSQYLSLADLAAVSCTSSGLREELWEVPEVWMATAVRDGLSLGSGHGVLCFGASKVRDAFRSATFRIDLGRLEAKASHVAHPLASGHTATLLEAAHVLRGLMPRDGEAIVRRLVELMTPVLLDHGVAAAPAAEGFLGVARGRSDLLCQADLEALQDAYGHAVLQQELVNEIMCEHFGEVEAQMRTTIMELQRCEQ